MKTMPLALTLILLFLLAACGGRQAPDEGYAITEMTEQLAA